MAVEGSRCTGRWNDWNLRRNLIITSDTMSINEYLKKNRWRNAVACTVTDKWQWKGVGVCGRKERLKFLRTGKNLTRAVWHGRGMTRYVVRKAVAKWGNFVCGKVESFVSFLTGNPVTAECGTCVCINGGCGDWRRFSPKLRSMCHCLYQVVSQRFQQSSAEAVWTVVGTVIFLRFINPAIGTIYSKQSPSLHCALASCGAVYCNRSCLWVVGGWVCACVFVGLLPW